MPKIVFITGATSGFGKACAEKFASECYDLILNGRREERLEEIKYKLEKQFNVAVYLLPFDVRHRENVFDAVKKYPDTGQATLYLLIMPALLLGAPTLMEAKLT